MRPTQSYIQQKFEEYNHLCFEDKLPPIRIVMTRARTYLGLCFYRTQRGLLGRKRYYDFCLRFSTLFDLPEEVIEDVILHEMIHYYIAYNRLRDTSSHGRLFRQMMNDINTRYGRHITISRRLTTDERAEANSRRRPHVVAVIRLQDGRVGIKVVPRTRERFVGFRQQMLRVPDVSSVDFYMTDNPFFNAYPTSVALRVYFLTEQELAEQLRDARQI